MRGLALAWLWAALGLMLACSSPNIDRDMRYATLEGGGSGPLIVVEEFELAVEPERYDARGEWIAVGLAQRTVRHLREQGRRAVARPRGASEPAGDLLVQGRVVKADGGSQTAREWVGMGAGGSLLGVTVRVLGPAGEARGQFDTERRSSRALNSVVLMQYCADRVGLDIARWMQEEGL